MPHRPHRMAWTSALLVLFFVLPAGGFTVLDPMRAAGPAETSPPTSNEEREEREERQGQEERHATERDACRRRPLPPLRPDRCIAVLRPVVAAEVAVVRASVAPRPHPKLFSVRRLM